MTEDDVRYLIHECYCELRKHIDDCYTKLAQQIETVATAVVMMDKQTEE